MRGTAESPASPPFGARAPDPAPAVAQDEDFVQDRVRFLNMFMSDLVAVPYLVDDNLLEAFLTLPNGREFDNFKKVRGAAGPTPQQPLSRAHRRAGLRAAGQRRPCALV